MEKNIRVDVDFLTKVGSFTKIALKEIDELEERIYEFRKKEAAEFLEQSKYDVALKKAADALYDADFLTDEYEKRQFMKKATEDPVYVVRFLEKVCNAADVSLIGKPARVASSPKQAEYDPVMAKAFGHGSSAFLED